MAPSKARTTRTARGNPSYTSTIREGIEADARAIAEVHVRSWQAAYRGQIPDRVLDGLSVADRERNWRQALRQAISTKARVWVAELEGRILGFAATGPTRDRDHEPDRVAEVYAIYLEPEAWGRGIGRALFARGVNGIRGQGFDEATLWVLESNDRARTFYEDAGWRTDGTARTDEMEGIQLKEVRYHFVLAPQS